MSLPRLQYYSKYISPFSLSSKMTVTQPQSMLVIKGALLLSGPIFFNEKF